MFTAQQIIKNKRDKKVLSKEEIDFFIKGITNNNVSNEQIAAFAMAIFLNKLNGLERANLTLAMKNSGKVLTWNNINGPVADKHSTGGVGDLVSLILAPVLAACGVYLPMIVGRSLGHTGGTADKLDSIPNYNTTPSIEKFQKTVKNLGCAIIAQTEDLAPADRKMYAIRDISGSVESIDLISASILSKKLAEGIDYLVMDVKTGKGAFMQSLEDAEELAKSIVEIGKNSNVKTTALITDMNEVLAKNVGNNLEIIETIEYLTGTYRDQKLHNINLALGIEILLSTKICKTKQEAEGLFLKNLNNGKATEIFAKMVAEFGGPSDFIENYKKYLPNANIIQPVFAKNTGTVSSIDPYAIGMEMINLKGSRRTSTDKINYTVGFSNFVKVGDFVDNNNPLCFIHAETTQDFENAKNTILKSIEINSNIVNINKDLIYNTIY